MVINAHFKHNGGPFKNVSMMVTKVYPQMNFLLNAEALFASTGAISVKGALQGFYFSENHYTLLT